jgi:hypothetical protein
VKFKVTRHSGFAPPADALDLLWQRLGAKRDEVSFAKADSEIRAAWEEGAAASMDRAERSEIGRLAVLQIVRDVCERAPELRLEWYAVSPLR